MWISVGAKDRVVSSKVDEVPGCSEEAACVVLENEKAWYVCGEVQRRGPPDIVRVPGVQTPH